MLFLLHHVIRFISGKDIKNTINIKAHCPIYPSIFGLYIARPDTHYFATGKISDKQLTDYERRMGVEREEIGKWIQ